MMKRKLICLVTLVVIAAVFTSSWFFYIPEKESIEKYTHAKNLVLEEQYEEAMDELMTQNPSVFCDVSDLIYLCKSHIVYEDGEIVQARRLINRMKDLPYPAEEWQDSVQMFSDLLDEEYLAHQKANYKPSGPVSWSTVTGDWDKKDKDTSSHAPYNPSSWDDDPYHAEDYANAEDFYDDYYDDFIDYEEAEDYFNEYGD